MRTKPIANDRKSNEIYRNRCAPRILGTVDVFLEKLFMFLAICLGVHMIAAKFYIFFHTILLHQSHFSSTFIHFHIEHTYFSKYFAIKKQWLFEPTSFQNSWVEMHHLNFSNEVILTNRWILTYNQK